MYYRSEATENALSKRLNPSILTVPIGDGFVRQYRYNTKSKDGSTRYYRCSSCDSKNRKDKTGILAKVKVKNGVISSDQPRHHPDCRPIEEVKALAREIDRSCRKGTREGHFPPRDWYNKVIVCDWCS